MEFAAVLARVLGFLAEQGHPAALVGGLALAAYGMPRATLDVDVVTGRTAQDGLVAVPLEPPLHISGRGSVAPCGALRTTSRNPLIPRLAAARRQLVSALPLGETTANETPKPLG